jgi:hypothetical protein
MAVCRFVAKMGSVVGAPCRHCEETYTGTVGRPAGIHGTVCAREDSFDARTQGTEPEFAARAKGERSTVRGERGLRAHVTLDFKGCTGWRHDGREDW